MNTTAREGGGERPTGDSDGIAGDGGKVQRLTRQTLDLVDEIRSWVELKMMLTQIEIEEKVDEKVNQAIKGAVIAALFFMAALLGLTAAALGIGEWLGHPAWGFLAVTVVLLVVGFVLRAARPKILGVRTPELPMRGSSDG